MTSAFRAASPAPEALRAAARKVSLLLSVCLLLALSSCASIGPATVHEPTIRVPVGRKSKNRGTAIASWLTRPVRARRTLSRSGTGLFPCLFHLMVDFI